MGNELVTEVQLFVATGANGPIFVKYICVTVGGKCSVMFGGEFSMLDRVTEVRAR